MVFLSSIQRPKEKDEKGLLSRHGGHTYNPSAEAEASRRQPFSHKQSTKQVWTVPDGVQVCGSERLKTTLHPRPHPSVQWARQLLHASLEDENN